MKLWNPARTVELVNLETHWQSNKSDHLISMPIVVVFLFWNHWTNLYTRHKTGSLFR